MKKRGLFWLVLGGILSIIFLTLLTVSFYRHVLKQIGVDYAENTREYQYHYVMIVRNTESQLWNDVYENVRREAANADAYVELKGKNQSTDYTMVDFMDMSIAAGADGILLEYTDEAGLKEKIDEVATLGIPVITLLNDAPTTKRSSYVGINSYQLGQDYGHEIMKLLPEDKEELLITVLLRNHSIDSNQSQIFNRINNIMVTSEETAGRIRVREIAIDSSRAFESERIVWRLFQDEQQQPDIIVCLDEVDTETVYHAVIDYNRVGKTQIIGYYTSSTALEAVNRGTMSKTLSIDTEEIGRYSVQAMTECIRDGRTNSFYSVELKFVSKDNVAEFIKD